MLGKKGAIAEPIENKREMQGSSFGPRVPAQIPAPGLGYAQDRKSLCAATVLQDNEGACVRP
jgi:hypothetical protein